MAERRMFAKSIVLSDAFLDMPMSARCLYFTLGMLADDDGFVGGAKSIMRQCGASQDDMMLLLQKRFVLGFDSGVIVIKHWRMNNYLQKDRYKPTNYEEEFNRLSIENNGAYTECIQNVYTGKDSIGKYSIDNTISSEQNVHSQVVITLPLKSGSKDITEEDVDKYKNLYPKVDVLQELKNMYGWLDSNPSKRKTKQGINRFINGWLQRTNEKNPIEITKVPDYIRRQKEGKIKDTPASQEALEKALELQRKLGGNS